MLCSKLFVIFSSDLFVNGDSVTSVPITVEWDTGYLSLVINV